MRLFVFSLSLVLLSLALSSVAVPDDKHKSCEEWAEAGEWVSNPSFMLLECSTSCDRVQKARAKVLQRLENIDSFYDLKSKDIDGNVVDFTEFKGKVVVLTNVASYCGYTESHYKGLVDLWAFVNDEVGGSDNVEVLAFPCNQFGSQEPGSAASIRDFAKQKGVWFRMMEKINVNGPNADLVYVYLKEKTAVAQITWNFATYFVVGPDGSVESYSGVEPMDLKNTIRYLVEGDEL